MWLLMKITDVTYSSFDVQSACSHAGNHSEGYSHVQLHIPQTSRTAHAVGAVCEM